MKCKYWDTDMKRCGDPTMQHPCLDNVGKECNIIPKKKPVTVKAHGDSVCFDKNLKKVKPKKKPRLVRVKGRVFFAKEKHGPMCIDTCSMELTDTLEMSFRKHGDFRITMLIDRKHLKKDHK